LRTDRTSREVTVPALERGLERSGRTRGQLEISFPAFVVTGSTEEEMAKSDRATREQIAFYGSTPAYVGVLEHHGWGEAHGELNALSKQGRWKEMGELIDDDMLQTFAVVGEPEQLAAGLAERFGDVVDRVSFYAPYASDPDRWTTVMRQIHAA